MDITARRYDTHEVVCLGVAGGRVQRLMPLAACEAPTDVPWVAPGLVDLQVNGYGGLDFLSPTLTRADVIRLGAALASQGAVRYCPTLTTDSFPRLAQALGTIHAACEADATIAAHVAGVHLEGPYISPEDGPRGAHPRQHTRPPDWDEFQRLQAAAGGRIRILTLSPEYPGAANFIAQVAASGVLVSIGHTNADSHQIRAAVDNLYISDTYGYDMPNFARFWFSRGGFSRQANLLEGPVPYLARDQIKHFLRAYFNGFASTFYPEIRMCNEHSNKKYRHGTETRRPPAGSRPGGCRDAGGDRGAERRPEQRSRHLPDRGQAADAGTVVPVPTSRRPGPRGRRWPSPAGSQQGDIHRRARRRRSWGCTRPCGRTVFPPWPTPAAERPA